MNIDRRALRAEFRATDTKARRFEAKVMVYGVVDDYGTMWTPGVFKDYLAERMPRIAWAHDWSEPLGRYVDFTDTSESLTLVGEFDDFDAVPRARQAYAQLQSGTIDQFSVGFVRKKWLNESELSDGERSAGAVERMVKADLPETSPVLQGAVPGTQLVGVRSVRMANGLVVPEDLVIDLGRKVDAGELTEAQAKAALKLAAGDTPPKEPDDELDALLAEADEALADL